MATTYTDLIPIGVARDVVSSVADRESGLMQLARTIPMPSGIERVPVVSASPTAGFVTPAIGGLKPEGSVDWTAEVLTAAEIATIVAIPTAFIEDTTFPVWESVRDEIAGSFARVFELAALYGTTAPADWPTGGLVAAAQADAVSGATAVAALDAALGNLEGKGVAPDGILGGAALRAALRAQMVDVMRPFDAAPLSVFGVPVRFSPFWNDTLGLALVGGFQNVLVGLRTDIRYDLSEDGVISDATGAILLNAFQQDSVLLRAYWRVALQEALPLGSGGSPVKPLALASVVVPVGAAGAAKK